MNKTVALSRIWCGGDAETGRQIRGLHHGRSPKVWSCSIRRPQNPAGDTGKRPRVPLELQGEVGKCGSCSGRKSTRIPKLMSH